VLFISLVFCVMAPRLLLLLSRQAPGDWALRNH
jgi:hypothetical protein